MATLLLLLLVPIIHCTNNAKQKKITYCRYTFVSIKSYYLENVKESVFVFF